MATIIHQRWTDMHLNYVLGAGTPAPPASWTMSLNTTAVSAMARNSAHSVTVSGTNINEIGSTTAAGYARQTIAKSFATGSIDWGTTSFDNTLSTGGTSSVADQVTFGAFTGAGPSPNGAVSFTLTDGSTINAGNPYMSSDTAATRTFAVGDTEKVTLTAKSG